MSRYALARHVFACRDGEHVVLLDLRRDRYFSFDAAKARGLQSLVRGWPVKPDDEVGRSAEAEVIARKLLERGLLARHDATEAGKPNAIVGVNAEMIGDHYEEIAGRSAAKLVSFIAATITAAVVLRFGSLHRAVRRVEKRKARKRVLPAPHAQRTRELLAVFTDLRPFLFTSRDRCLFESFVLIEFLARYGIFPSWMFGVQSRPFAAHCWVQQGDVALNDTVEHLARYTPIMAV